MATENHRPFILVTGAAGFIASHLINRLFENGINVVGVDNFDPFYSRSIKDENIQRLHKSAADRQVSLKFIEADINSLRPEMLAEFEFETVIHLAAKAGVAPSLSDPLAYLEANIRGTLNLLELSRKIGIPSFIFGSSSSVYGNDSALPFSEEAQCDRPISPYAASKRAGELYCYNYAHLYQMKLGVLRFFTVYGPRQRPDLAIHKFADEILDGKKITVYGDGESIRDYTFVDDIVDGIEKTRLWLKNAPAGTFETINLGGANPVSINKLLRLLETHLGRARQVEHAESRAGDVQGTFANVEKARKLLGYSPKVSIEEGIHRFCEWKKTVN